MMKKEHYGAIDGLRTIACIGIVMMHVAANTDYSITGFFYNSMIPSFTNFVFLFMTVSAFGMCCGYYHKMLNNQINLSDFYTKRFKKILPFFALLVLIDVLLSPSLNGIYEAFADLTLLFGFLPNAGNISVIGVGWFLGLIFVFYVCFPFYCVLIKNKKRAWISFFLSLFFNFVCSVYFDVGRTNILYSSCYLIAGGLIYLYRTNIRSLNQWVLLAAVLFSVVLYYLIGANTLTCLLVSSSLLIYAISNRGGILQNKFTAFISTISMEVYLSHMVIFRIVERLGLHQVIGNGWLQYFLTLLIVLFGTVMFSIIAQKVLNIFITKLDQLLA
ncbi:acyltransferase [Faecalicoccus pleomorphus]|uniref:acyltransferase family protein n=1 Tax=Faecalicoccus pleomorphus TaxID=1323 RepID=UPI00195FF4D7|nr:acyltransferase [Faecalicoccus pleomorphus]MBM6765062.1 acyltransferase [Faecalicoccus pleomorphus]